MAKKCIHCEHMKIIYEKQNESKQRVIGNQADIIKKQDTILYNSIIMMLDGVDDSDIHRLKNHLEYVLNERGVLNEITLF